MEPVELLVKDGTDQGQRRAGKVARAYIPGTQRILAELLFPRLVMLDQQRLVLSGIEREIDGYKQSTGFAQSWVCRLAPPLSGLMLYVGEMYFYGQPVPRRRMRERHGGCHAGHLMMESALLHELKRVSQVATFEPASGGRPSRLLDAELQWMAEDSFALTGTHVAAADKEKPETAYEGGWLCSYFPLPPTDEGKRIKVVTASVSPTGVEIPAKVTC